MKILFFITLLANLFFFFWQYNEGGFDKPNSSQIAQVENQSKQIQLLAEVEQIPSNNLTVTANLNPPVQTIASAQTGNNTEHPVFKAPAPKPAPVVVPLKKQCYQIGHFATPADADNWLKQQAGLYSAARKLSKNKVIGVSYQVYYPAAARLEQSRKNLQIAKSLGVREVFLIKEKPFLGDLSFGIFTEQDRALTTQRSLRAKQIYAYLRKIPKTGSLIYLRLKSEKTKSQLAPSLTSYQPKLTIETVAKCH